MAFERAEDLVVRAIGFVESSSLARDAWWRKQRLAELEHRLNRVRQKRARLSAEASPKPPGTGMELRR